MIFAQNKVKCIQIKKGRLFYGLYNGSVLDGHG
nr:MAG TPA: hypothetical protein [Caudoviricetes sp.]